MPTLRAPLVAALAFIAVVALTTAAALVAPPADASAGFAAVDRPVIFPPDAPALHGSADVGTLLSATAPALTWDPSQPGTNPVAEYRILLDGQQVSEIDATQTSWSAPAPIPDGGHVWLVIAVDSSGNDSNAARQTFTVDTRLPSPTLLVLSTAPVTAGTQVRFDATVAPESSPPIVRYEWDMDGNGTFERDTGPIPSTTGKWARPGMPLVHVRVTDVFGRTSIASVRFVVVAKVNAPKLTSVTPVHAPGDAAMSSSRPAVTISPGGPTSFRTVTVTTVSHTPVWVDAEVRGWGGRVSGWRPVWTGPLVHATTAHLTWAGQVAGGKRTARDGPYQLQVCWYAAAPVKAIKRAHAKAVTHGVVAKAQQFTHAQAVVDDDDRPLTAAERKQVQETPLADRHPKLGIHHCVAKPIDVQLQRLSISTPATGSTVPGSAIPVDVTADQRSVTVSLIPASHGAVTAVAYATVTPGTTGSITVPAGAAPGLYQLEVKDSAGNVRATYVVVRNGAFPVEAPAPGTALVVWPELTWRAYNGFDSDRDGIPDSWYELWSQRRVSLTGPLEPGEHDLAQSDSFSDWLTGHPAASSEPITDVELASMPPSVLARYSAIVFPGHTEYYMQSEYDLLAGYRAGGGHIAFLSANSFYRRVGLDLPSQSEILLDQVERTDSQSDFLIATTGYADSGFTAGAPFTVAPSAVTAVPWLFAGTGLVAGSSFGVAATEVDRIDGLMSPPQTQLLASARLQGTHNVVDADMAYTVFPGGGTEFSSGDFDFLSDDIVSWRLLTNVWDHEVGAAG